MSPIVIVIICVAAFLLLSAVGLVLFTWPIAKRVYFDTLVRTSPEKWNRENSCPENEEQTAMFEEGLELARGYADRIIPVETENDGLKLYGEYFDLGCDRCVIIIAGRCESLLYGYYFAKPYIEAGCNVLVFDSRAHGKSEGKFNTVGIHECGDLIKWIELVENRFGNKRVYLHGICIGGATCIQAAVRADCPACVDRIVVEGLYTSFWESFKQHLIYDHHPVFPVLQEVWFAAKHYSNADILRQSPINCIRDVKVPVLFLHGKMDTFSLPAKGEMLYNMCPNPEKRLRWFEKGAHSHLRINAKEQYDNEVIDFIGK